MTPAFLLTRHWVDDRDGVRLEFWLTSERGPLAVCIHAQQALFFIRQADTDAVSSLLAGQAGVSIKPLELKTFNAEPVSAVYFKSQQQLYRARDRLTHAGLSCFEADIRPTERFLTTRATLKNCNANSGTRSEDERRQQTLALLEACW